jgi:hypothetical protein
LGVVKFREQLVSMVFVHEYDGAALFADTVRPNLAQIVGRVFLREGSSSDETSEEKTDAGEPLDLSNIVGRPVTLIAIGPQDACYGQRSKYLGRAGIVIEAEERDDWLRGTFRFDVPLFPGDNRIYSFLRFLVGLSA